MALFLTPRQVSERWGCSPRQVRRLCASGDLRAMRLGLEAWRIALADVETYERSRTAIETPKPEASRKEGTHPISTGGFTVPANYQDVYAELWGTAPAPTKKAASQRH